MRQKNKAEGQIDEWMDGLLEKQQQQQQKSERGEQENPNQYAWKKRNNE